MQQAINQIEITQPDDWHIHLRDGDFLSSTVPACAKDFGRAIVMPNLKQPICTTQEARDYKARILKHIPKESNFTPLMTSYLTEQIQSADLIEGFNQGLLTAAKLYPAHATTNSSFGVRDVEKIYPVLEQMEKAGMPLLIHGEVTDKKVDIFDREAVFIETTLTEILKKFPGLRVVLEHITTAEAVDFVRLNNRQLAASITPHHLVINRSDLFEGGIRPHLYCLPIAKREKHRLSLRKAATSGEDCFFLGTDSAPHLTSQKETDCGCAGIFSSPTALGIYLQVFEEEGALHHFEKFASLNGAKFYGLPINPKRVAFEKVTWTPDKFLPIPKLGEVRIFRGEEKISWRSLALRV